jgi:hypothetical protein
MNKQVAELAFHGNWAVLLPLLRDHPHLVNAASELKAYTPLHQTAWHGANLAVVGELLAIGADRGLKTHNKHQTAQDIAIEKHADRADLEYILAQGSRTLAQLMRKVVSNTPDLFTAYDGNQTVCDRLIECFGSDSCHHTDEEVEVRVDAAFRALTGVALSSSRAIECGPNESFKLRADTSFWEDRFLPALREYMSRAHVIPIEKEWAVVSDLFDPAPDQWGLRGDLFLWMEMRQALCHVEIPQQPEGLAQTISSAFMALTGTALARSVDFPVNRLARGGMSGGMVCGQFWIEEFIPLLQQRSKWLQETWRR